jgi:hypothetical protein
MMGKKFLVFLIIAAALYTAFTTLIHLDSNEAGLLVERKTGRVLQAVLPGMNFVPRAFLVWKNDCIAFPRKNTDRHELKVPITRLEALDITRYSVSIPLKITYEIKASGFTTPAYSSSSVGSPFCSEMKLFLEDSFRRSLAPFMNNDFKRDDIIANISDVISKARSELESHAASMGVTIDAFDVNGTVAVPASDVYSEGLRFLAELSEAENRAKKELILFTAELKREELRTQQYIRKLSSVSALLKEYPDIIRYIYVDRLSKNVKVIVTQDKAGYPFALDGGVSAPVPKGEIDNLR